SESGRRRSLILILTMVAGILFLAAVAPKALPFSSSSGPGEPIVPDLPPAADVVLVALSIALLLSALLIRTVVTGVDRDKLQQRKPVWMQLIIFGLILLGAAAFSRAVRDQEYSDNASPRPSSTARGPEEMEEADARSSRALGWVLTGLLVALTLGTAGGTAWLIGKVRAAPTPAEGLDDLLSEIDEGHRRILEGADAKASVIACYLGMVEVLQAGGVPQKPSDAPFEYVERALRGFDVSRKSAHQLTELFERARFSPHEIDVSMPAHALRALTAVRDDLAARAEVTRRTSREA
ncbi:MAG: DUF4129 domain-containing protein, partial [Actinomycetota bacterium]